LAIGGDLSVERLLNAYSSGIFPWFNQKDPILWWSPNPRPIIIPGKMRMTKSLAKLIKSNVFSLSIDKSFEAVIEACAKTLREGKAGTWITTEMKNAYVSLHKMGFCHSAEAWKDGKLVGGLYGVALGKAFFGESMFHSESNASKVAFYHLSEFLAINDFHFIDGQVSNPHLISLGAIEIDREDFLRRLQKALKFTTDNKIWKDN